MMLLLRLAFRNLARNRTRTILNLTMVIGAFISIVFFKGFSNFMLWSMEDGLPRGQTGHIQIASESVWSGDMPKSKETAYLPDADALAQKLSAIPGVEKVSGRANVPVLISNGDKTIGAMALGFDPKVENNVEGALYITEGAGFSKTSDFEILVSAGFQSNLQLKIGQTISVVAQSLSGSMSSLELEVRGVVKSGFADVDSSTVYIPLKAAQGLLETDRVERVAILLKPDTPVKPALEKARSLFSMPGFVIKDWKDISVLFRQVEDFYNVQDRVVEIILVVLVFFGILNTVGMSVYERIGEIGTMRALGDRRSQILALLGCEGCLLGVMGVLIGIPVTVILTTIFSGLDIRIAMPGTSLPVPIQVTPYFPDYVVSSFAVILTCFISTLWPAQRAVRMAITDALRANS